ncbi:glycoside hydrolase family 172 protein [Autumnicola musiva]|uniref:Glycoside hydrolase family 172 protein n=1 Tax=Autumnicola musiva TaxID=3075589 RepID=A0ABU3DAK0_9FLAO|nr:glycoside hydrolase family 172 protein [Zunongwangia sp. F117]MDT0678501.1 glycoside hydrolase family 172 protein [Zunongwangia sp. F117]
MRKLSLWLIVFVFLACEEEKKSVSYLEVVNKLTDLKALAKLPESGENSAMWSSYDRESKIDPETGEFIKWDANNDGLKPQFIRKEGDKEVLAEMEGPGAIVRIWSASPRNGQVKIYIDGQEEPVVDLPFIDYFKPSIPAFDFSELVYETNARGFNNYVPITYKKSCKVVAEPGWGQYYQFNYISFPEGTEVEPFDSQLKETNRAALEKVNSFFAEDMGESPYKSENPVAQIQEQVSAGEEKQVYKLNDAGAISSLKARVTIKDSSKTEEILRKVVLKIKWDGEEEAAVWSPLGDFFGTSPGWNEYKTLPMGMTKDWMYSYWYMPYEDGAEIIIHNEYGEDVEIEMEIAHESLEEVQGMGRFHAKWHRDLEPLKEERWPDWTLLETEGRGRFVGTHLNVWSPKGGSCSLGGPGQHWWGEGDEKFFIDGEDFPSTFGTGTEDYFGYAWCIPSVFAHAFHSQTQDNDNMGYQPMNRWHVIDNIPFQKSFDGYLEKYFPNHWPTQYATVVYWYLEPGGKDPLGQVAVEERYGYETPFEVYREESVVEGEDLKIEKNTGGWGSDVWTHEDLFKEVSGHKILIWNANPNNKNELVTNFEWPEEGTYEVEANIIKSKQGGEFTLKLNGTDLQPINFYSDSDEQKTERIVLGTVQLEPGIQNLVINWKGQKEDGKNLRLDYLKYSKK